MSLIRIPSYGSASAVNFFNQLGATNGRVLFSNSDNLDHLSVVDKDGNVVDLETPPVVNNIDELNDIGDVTITGVTHGAIIYRNASGWVNLNPGGAGQVLTTNGPGTNPTWENVPDAADGNGIFDVDNNGGTVSSGFSVTLTDSLDINSTLYISDKVGIGTNTPTSLLTIGTASNGGEIALAGNTSGNVVIKPSASTTDYTLTLPENGGNISNFIFTNFGGEMMLSDGSGNLYFGTTPSLYLEENKVLIGNTHSYAEARTLSGDVGSDYTGSITIQPNVVTYGKMQTLSTKALLGNSNVSGGPVSEIPIIESFISGTSSAATLLENTGNWTGYLLLYSSS
jgi:hypothetical protein